MSKIHSFTRFPESFTAVLEGRKTCEILETVDVQFYVGDVLYLREWRPSPSNYVCTKCKQVMTDYGEFEEYQHMTCNGPVEERPDLGWTGRECRVEITHVMPGGTWGLPHSRCVVSIRIIQEVS